MRRTAAVLAIPGLMLAGAAGAEERASWAYEGRSGPDAWGALTPAYALCGRGRQQSPIDLTGAAPAQIDPPDINWRIPLSALARNTGRTVQIDLDGAGGLTIGEAPYALEHVSFRHESEHAIDGRRFPLEAQFVHAAADGQLAVIAVLFEEGDADRTLAAIWDAAPAAPGAAMINQAIDPSALLPKDRTAFHYAGSLTTPPCSEIVSWTVFKTPVSISADQIRAFQELYPKTNRPLQPRNRRFVLQTD